MRESSVISRRRSPMERPAVLWAAMVFCGTLIAICPFAAAQDDGLPPSRSGNASLEEAERMAEAALAEDAELPAEDASQTEPLPERGAKARPHTPLCPSRTRRLDEDAAPPGAYPPRSSSTCPSAASSRS